VSVGSVSERPFGLLFADRRRREQGEGARWSWPAGSPVVFDDLHFSERAYDPWLAYRQSKTANVLLGVETPRSRLWCCAATS